MSQELRGFEREYLLYGGVSVALHDGGSVMSAGEVLARLNVVHMSRPAKRDRLRSLRIISKNALRIIRRPHER